MRLTNCRIEIDQASRVVCIMYPSHLDPQDRETLIFRMATDPITPDEAKALIAERDARERAEGIGYPFFPKEMEKPPEVVENNEPKNQAVITVDLNKYELQSDQKLEDGKCSFTEIRIVRKPEVA